MSKSNDLFNSSKGQYSDYTTLIGGEPPALDEWFSENFTDPGSITLLKESVIVNNGVQPDGSLALEHAFEVNEKSDLANFSALLEYQTGENVSDFQIGVFGRKIDNDNYLMARITDGLLQVVKVESGSETVFAQDTVSLNPNSRYWLLALFVDDVLRCQHFLFLPTEFSFPDLTVTHVLSEADNATFDVSSKTGIASWFPIDDESRIDSFQVGKAFKDRSGDIETILQQKHVDIRDFINYRYPIRFRNLRELREFHITENAFAQIITLSEPAEGGEFSLLYYPSDNDPYIPIEIGPFAYDVDGEVVTNELNQVLNQLPRYVVTADDPVKSVVNQMTSENDPVMLIEFYETAGDMSLLRMTLKDITPPLQSEENYDNEFEIGTFFPIAFDDKFIETADPLDKQLTLDDLRIEYKFKNENWTLKRGFTGTTPPEGIENAQVSRFRPNDLILGKIASQQNRTGAQLSFSRAQKRDGAKWSVFLQSSIPATSKQPAINCAAIGQEPGVRPSTIDDENLIIKISFAEFPWVGGSEPAIDILEEVEAYEDGNPKMPGCFVQFTSNREGRFDLDGTSAMVPFKDHMVYEQVGDPNVEFVAKLNEFASTDEFDFSRITGVRIFLSGRQVLEASDEAIVTIMAIRCIDQNSDGGKQWLSAEINTLEQSVMAPWPKINQTELPLVPMVFGRGQQSIGSDPSPIDSRQSIIFRAGKLEKNEPAGFNRLMLFAREQEFDNLFRSSWLTAEYLFRMDLENFASFVKRYQTVRVRSEDGSTPVLFWDTHPGEIFVDEYTGQQGISFLPRLNEDVNYEFSGIFSAHSIRAQIQELSSAEQPLRVIYDASLASDELWQPISGRIGWYAEFSDKDMQISAVDLDSAGYALLRTKPFKSETPIEGAQLFTVDSGIKNLFENFLPLSVADNVTIDNQRTISGQGSFRFESFGSTEYPGVISNEFFVDDWSHMYIEFDIWVPESLKTAARRPKFLLLPAEQPVGTSGFDVFSGIVPSDAPVQFNFVPGAWSRVYYDLRGINAKNGDYFFVIASDGDGLSDESSFRNRWWVDNVQINTQTIEWEMRAIDGGSWTPFRRNINKKYGALHLSRNQIGRSLQLQARALTEDAWIAEYTVFPKYLSLGRIVDTNRYILEDEVK